MDPDVALDQVRRNMRFVAGWLENEPHRVTAELITALDELVLHGAGLDEFLSNGGFLPTPWHSNVRHS